MFLIQVFIVHSLLKRVVQQTLHNDCIRIYFAKKKFPGSKYIQMCDVLVFLIIMSFYNPLIYFFTNHRTINHALASQTPMNLPGNHHSTHVRGLLLMQWTVLIQNLSEISQLTLSTLAKFIIILENIDNQLSKGNFDCLCYLMLVIMK